MMKNFVAIVVIASQTYGLRPRATTLEEWIDGLKLKFEVDFDDRFAGIKVEVDDMDCERVEVDVIRAEYLSPRGLYLDINDINTKCEGDYDWSYNTVFGRVRGDGKVEAVVKNSRVEIELEVVVDELGAPTALRVDRCDADIKITDIDTRGDPLGDAANAFVDEFADFFRDDIEKIVCDTIEDYEFNLIPTLRNLGINACVQSLPRENTTQNPAPALKSNRVVNWDDVVQNATGPGAALIAAVYKATNKPRPAEVIEYGLDLASDLDLPLASAKDLNLKGSIAIIETPEKNKPEALIKNLSFYLSNASLIASTPLSEIGLDAYVDGESELRPERIGLGFTLPESLAFNASADAELTAAVGEVGDWFSQDLLSPILRLRAGLGLDVWDLSLDAVLALGLSPPLTRQGLDALFLGDVAAFTCWRPAFNLVEAALPKAHIGYQRSSLSVRNTRFVPPSQLDSYPDDSLENQIANSVIPAIIDLVELGFPDFTQCAIDEYLQTTAVDSISDTIRDFAGIIDSDSAADYQKRCENQRPDWVQSLARHQDASLDDRLVPISKNSLARLAAETAADLSIDELLIAVAEEVAIDDVTNKYKREEYKSEARQRFVETATSPEYLDHVIVIAKNAADKIRIGPLSTTLRFSDLFVANLDRAIGNVTLVPGGKKALNGATRVEFLESANSERRVPITLGFSLEIESPIGDAQISVNASFYNVRVESFGLDLFLDSPTLNALNVGSDLGISSLFTQGATINPLASCLLGAFQGISFPNLPKTHVGRVSLEAWSDVDGLEDVVKSILNAAIGFVNEFVTVEAARDEITWLLNDVIDNQIKTAKETCQTTKRVHQVVNKDDHQVPVAPRRDVRGDRPSALARNDAEGVSGDLALTADAFAVVLIIAVMFATFAFIWFRKKRKAKAGRALAKYMSSAKAMVMESMRLKRKNTPFSPTAKGAMQKNSILNQNDDDAAQDFAQAYVGAYDDDNTEDETFVKTDMEEVRPTLHKKRRPLIVEAPLPAVLRYGLLLIMIANTALLVTSNVALAAQARIKLFFQLADVGDDTIWLGTNSKFSLIESVTQLWEAGSILLALLVAGLSGLWPYLEIGLLIWGYTANGLEPKKREWVWRCVEMLSKWSFIDVFIVVFLVVAFYIDVDLKVSDNGSRFQAELFIEPRYAFYAFCFATLTSMCLGQIVLNLHREVHHLGRGRFHALERRTTETNTQAPCLDAAPTKISPTAGSYTGRRRSLANHPLHGKPPRRWQCLVAPCVLCVGILLVIALLVDVVVFEVGGAAGFLIDITDGSQQSKKLSAPGIAYELPSSTPNDGWSPLVKVLEFIVLIFACLIPLLHVLLLGILWLIPFTATTQVRILALADVAYGWSSLDVYLVTILATATQVNKLSESLAKDQCRSINGYIAAFFDQAIDGDLTCFQVAVKVKTGCVLLAVACFAQMTLGYLTASATSAAVAERVVQAALGRPNDASILIDTSEKEANEIELVAPSEIEYNTQKYAYASAHTSEEEEHKSPLPLPPASKYDEYEDDSTEADSLSKKVLPPPPQVDNDESTRALYTADL